MRRFVGGDGVSLPDNGQGGKLSGSATRGIRRSQQEAAPDLKPEKDQEQKRGAADRARLPHGDIARAAKQRSTEGGWICVSLPRQCFGGTPAAHSRTIFGKLGRAGEDFYAAITAAPAPVDMRDLRALKRSPLALNLYAWLVHTAFTASRKREARVVPWEGFHGQMEPSTESHAEPRRPHEPP